MLSDADANIGSVMPAKGRVRSAQPVENRRPPGPLRSRPMATAAQGKRGENPHLPPQNLDAEESVLGAMMLSPSAIAVVSEVLSSDGREFYRESHAKIYRAALGLYVKGEPVDAITLVDELDERGELDSAGGKVRIHELAALDRKSTRLNSS